MIFARKTFGRLDKAFGILFLLLFAFVGLHVSTVTEMRSVFSSGVPQVQMAANLQQFRGLERDLQCCLDHLRSESLDVAAKASVLDRELENIEGALHELAGSPTQVFGLTRLVEPYIYIRDVRRKIVGEPENIDVLLEPGGETERALEATLFVVRNNVMRLGEEQSTV
ncbi:MAG: hypothetical protein O7B26_03250, partial [Planctomycetota bacterium]|nr:hypothetical protein [Planctomycetota bacterium]